MGPKVIPKKPKPNGSLSNVMMKKPINIITMPVININMLFESNGNADLFEELFILKKD
jgi:hypothetical protein